MKLLFVNDAYSPFGGLQRDMLRIGQGCARHGHWLTMLVGGWHGPKPDDPRIEVKEVSLKAATNHGGIRRLERAAEHERATEAYDVVVGFKKHAGLDVYFAGDVCLAAQMAAAKRTWHRWLPRYRSYLENERAVFSPGSSTQVLLLSPAQREQFTAHYQTPAHRLHLLPPQINRPTTNNDAESAETDRRSVRAELGVPADLTLMLCVGSYFKCKGVDRAIRALSWVTHASHHKGPDPARTQTQRQAHLAVVGEDKPGPMQRLARRHGVEGQVHFLGGRNDVPRLYQAADLLLHAARTETTGTVILEALVHGVPVLVSENCGYASYIDHAAAGLVCPEPFKQSTFNRMLGQAMNADQRAHWAAQARHYADEHSLTGLVDQAVEVILRRGE